MSRETLYIFFILAKRNCHSSNSCQIDNINIFLNKKQPFSKLKNLIPTSKYKTLKLTGYSWSITDPNNIHNSVVFYYCTAMPPCCCVQYMLCIVHGVFEQIPSQ